MATGAGGIFEPNPNRAAALENLRKRCEMFSGLSVNRVYFSLGTTGKCTVEDYNACPAKLHEAANVAKQFNLSLRIEFIRTSTFMSVAGGRV
jgi:hypothetical protein